MGQPECLRVRVGGDTKEAAAAGPWHMWARSRERHCGGSQGKLNLAQQGSLELSGLSTYSRNHHKKEEGIEAELLTVQFQTWVSFKDVVLNYTKEE